MKNRFRGEAQTKERILAFSMDIFIGWKGYFIEKLLISTRLQNHLKNPKCPNEVQEVETFPVSNKTCFEKKSLSSTVHQVVVGPQGKKVSQKVQRKFT